MERARQVIRWKGSVQCVLQGKRGAGEGGLTYKERPDLGIFEEGLFESVFVEIVRGGGRRNDVVGWCIDHLGEIWGVLMRK